MAVEHLVVFVVGLLLLSVFAEWLAARLRLPHSLLLLLLGAAGGYLLTGVAGIDTGLRATSFHDLVFFVFLPVLIFEAAYKIELAVLRENLAVILFLAIAGMLLTTGIAAVLLYFGIGHPTGFPWIAALLTGALLAATDPVAVVQQLHSLGAPARLGVLLEGESLFNDATAIVVFSIFLVLATMPAAEVSAAGALVDFGVTFFGGGLVGLVAGAACVFLRRLVAHGVGAVALTLIAAYGSFLLAEAALHVSGVMASLVAGLVLARSIAGEPRLTETQSQGAVEFFWTAIAYVANGCVFLLMGMTVTLAMFTERWLAMLIAVLAIIVARFIATYSGVGLMNLFLRDKVPLAYQGVLVWGGLRGAVTLALALSLPTELPYWWTIQSMAFGVVLFTLLVQAPTMPALLRRLQIDTRS